MGYILKWRGDFCTIQSKPYRDTRAIIILTRSYFISCTHKNWSSRKNICKKLTISCCKGVLNGKSVFVENLTQRWYSHNITSNSFNNPNPNTLLYIIMAARDQNTKLALVFYFIKLNFIIRHSKVFCFIPESIANSCGVLKKAKEKKQKK